MSIVYWIADGGGHKVTSALKPMMQWVRRQGDAMLIVYGGDVYGSGSSDDFQEFHKQCGHDLSGICAIPGNHDWRTSAKRAGKGTIAMGFEEFWAAAPASKATVVRADQSGNARYDHFKDDIPGWRLICVDTADDSEDEGSWPRGDDTRAAWLASALSGTPGRSKILLTHHSRLSSGNHGDQDALQPLWESLFDNVTGAHSSRSRSPATITIFPSTNRA
jgi:Calcineurin-like phosphoesterase